MLLVILIVMAVLVSLKHEYYFKCPLAKFDFKVHILFETLPTIWTYQLGLLVNTAATHPAVTEALLAWSLKAKKKQQKKASWNQQISASLSLLSFLTLSRTRRWTWNRCIGVWTVLWTRTWHTSRSPHHLSRSLPWTSAACRPASSGRLCETTRARACLWAPSSRIKLMGWAGHWPRVLAAPYPFLSAAPPCPPSNANTGHPTGACSDRVPPRRPCQCPTSQYQEDPSQKLLSIVHPSKAIVTMGCLILAFQRKKAEVQLELGKLWQCTKSNEEKIK